MPLPLLPLFAIVGAAVAGGVGVVAGLSAKEDFDEAKRLNEKAKDTFAAAKKSLERQRKRIRKRLVDLGHQKVQLHQDGLKPFVDAFSNIKKVEYRGLAPEDPQMFADEMLALQGTVKEMEKVVGDTADALGEDTLAQLAVYGSVGLLAPPSTDRAVLFDGPAANATLTWISGGEAGTGAAGAVLGGVVVLFGGLIMASKAEEALADARSNVKKAKTAEETSKTAKAAAQAIVGRADEVTSVLKALADSLDARLPKLDRLVRRNDDFSTYTTTERRLVEQIATAAKTAHSVAEAPLFDENGTVTKEIRRQLTKANDFLRTIHAM